MKYILYILKCSNNALYTGITNDLKKRLQTHRDGKGSKYVRANLPFKLIYTEKVENRSEALKREIEIKKMTHSQKKDLISG